MSIGAAGTGAYPRGCGEWHGLRLGGLLRLGLPPRVRGMGLRTGGGSVVVGLRACAGRRSLGAPAVSPVDEFGGEKQRDREGELGESVSWPAVGVAA